MVLCDSMVIPQPNLHLPSIIVKSEQPYSLLANCFQEQTNNENESANKHIFATTAIKSLSIQKINSGSEKDSKSIRNTIFIAVNREEFRRHRNNNAARRSRQARRAREIWNRERMKTLEQENGALRAQIEVLKAELERVCLVLVVINFTRKKN